MKHIYRYGDKGYVHMDTYPETPKTQPSDTLASIICILLVTGIAAVTAGAMIGIDLTKPQPTTTHQSK
jgi:hypothetical protein